MNKKMTTVIVTLSMMMLFAGCSGREAYNQRDFMLKVTMPVECQPMFGDSVLSVSTFSISDEFSSRSFVYRRCEAEYETDFHNQFLIKPEHMITQTTRKWLHRSGLFKTVLEPNTFADANVILEGSVHELFCHFQDTSTPKAVMKIRFFMLEMPDKAVTFDNVYEAHILLADNSPESVVDAYGQCLTKILKDLQTDLINTCQ